LYHLEPHNDDRIPIVLVHGLMSDIRTWLQLINTLQSDPELRKHYRFMGFSYSSGNPIFISAMQLRQALELEREKLQKDGRNLENFDRMVLIGHSMGGLLSRMMISTSNDELLCNFVGKDIYETVIDHQDEEFRKIMIFEPLPPVKRVIFIAVPHRGSELAQSIVGKTAAYFIKIPKSLIDFNTKLFQKLVNMPSAKKTDVGQFNGIDNLSPDGTALKLLNAMPISPDVPYHSIIGNRRRQNTPGGSDGIVSYSSSHLDGAVSEIVVQSGHSVQQNPLAIQEIKRILKEHLKSDGKK
jgi:pimeloyl-ACP methyl ester carboxylesterase